MSTPEPSEPAARTASELAARTESAFAPGGPLAQAFAGFVARSQQVELAGLIAAALDQHGTAVAEAGTGVGKTFAYLVPALLGAGKVIVSTGTRTLQDQLHGRDLPALQAALGVQASVALLKGRANYVCRHHLRRHLADGRFMRPELAEPLRRIEWFARSSDTGDRAACAGVPEESDAWALATSTRDNCLGQECPDWDGCFVVRARRAAQAAEIVVVNHHLFCADLALRDEGISELLPSANAVIFDEAHLLPQTGSLFFGVAVSARQLTELARDAQAVGLAQARDAAAWSVLAEAVQRAVRALRAAWPRAAPRAEAQALLSDPAFSRAAGALEGAVEQLHAALDAAAVRSTDLQRCAVRAGELRARLVAWRTPAAAATPSPTAAEQALPGPAEAPVRWAEAHAQSVTLHRTPVSVAGPFARQRDATRCAWVFVSATLALGGDFGHFTRALGLDDAACRRWDSPFDFARQARLYVPTDCGEPQHPAFTERMIAAAWPLLLANQGRAFVLCTSLRAVQRAAEALRERLRCQGGTGTVLTPLVQGELPRAELLHRFQQAQAPVLIGAASFWQGIDVRGEQLSLVVIDKLPFASPDDPVLQARLRALRSLGRDPFLELQLPAAAVTLKQGAGRLIRSERDRGVLMIADERLVSKSYGRRLLASLPPFGLTRDAHEAVRFILGAEPADLEAPRTDRLDTRQDEAAAVPDGQPRPVARALPADRAEAGGF